jgi:DNA-binding NtrC family response regulator
MAACLKASKGLHQTYWTTCSKKTSIYVDGEVSFFALGDDMAVPTGKARVLVVDDEDVIAKTLAIIFSNEGYETRAVQSAEAALAMLKTEEWVPQLAIIDVYLPGMNGIDLAIKLKTQYPELRMSLFSGQETTALLLEQAGQQGHFFEIIAKPVHPAILLGTASRLLGNDG